MPSVWGTPRRTVFLLFFATLTACGSARHVSDSVVGAVPPYGGPWHSVVDGDHPLVGRIYTPDPRGSGTFIDEATLVARLATTRFVLLGEKHDNVDHHRLQAALLGKLIAAGRRPALVLGMIDVDEQAVVDEQRAASPRDADALAHALGWEKKGWPPFPLYRPLVQLALAFDLPILGGDYPTREIRALFAPDAQPIDPAIEKRLGVDAALAPELQRSLEEELADAHCGMLPKELGPPMLLSQRLRDGQLAERMVAGDHDGAVLIAGAGHARADRGVPMILRAKGATSIASVAFLEVDPSRRDADAYASTMHAASLPFDYVWFTPRVDDDDPCAAMRAHEGSAK